MTDPLRERHYPKPHMTAVNEDGMCPNCCTPWKCNGPHVPEMQQDGEVCAWCGNRWPCDAIRAADERDAARADADRLAALVAESDDDGYCRWCKRMLYFFDESLGRQGGWHDDHSRHADDCQVLAALRAHDEATR